MAPVTEEPEVTLAQRLASNESSVRNKALKTLRKYINLRSQRIDGGFTIEDLMKIWKGLFYCLWMQDKPVLQEEISHRISVLIHSFHTSDAQLLYFASFLQTVKREWNGIDRLRMDKFFQLVRFVFRQTFEVLRRRQWEASLVAQFLQVFTEQLLQNTECVAKGLMLHILDLYLTELAQAGSAELTAEQNLTFIDPFCKIMAKTKDRVLLDYISKSIFRTILEQMPFAVQDLINELQQYSGDSDSGQASGNEEEEMEEKEKLKNKSSKKTKMKNGISKKVENAKKSRDDEDLDSIASEDADDIGPVLQFDYGAVADRLFELGSHLSTQNINRTRLYGLVKSFRSSCAEFFPEQEGDNVDLSSTSAKTSKKKKRKNEKPTAGDEFLAKKSKVQGGSEIEADGESASQHNEQDVESQVHIAITVKRKRKSKKPKADSQESGGKVAHQGQVVLQKSDDEHQTGNCKVKRKPKKCNMDSCIGNQSGTDVKNQNCAAQKPELASVVERPVEAEQAECKTSLMLKKNKKSKKMSINKREEKTDTEIVEKATEQIFLHSRLETEKEVTPAKAQNDGPGEFEAGTMEKTKRRKSKKLCSSLQDIEKDLTVHSLPKEDNAGDQIITLDTDTDTTQSQLKKKVKKNKSSLQNSKEVKPLAVLKNKQTEASSDSADIPANKNKDDIAEFSQPDSVRKAKKTKRLLSNGEESMIETNEKPAINNTASTQQADTPVRKKTLSKKQLGLPTEQAIEELILKKTVKAKPAIKVPIPALAENICTPEINSLTPTKKGKTKRKLQTDKADISQNNEHAEEEQSGKKSKMNGVEVSASVTPKKQKMKKGSAKSDFVSFQGLIKPPTPLFCKTKPKSNTPLTSIKEKFQTPKSESKKVTFGLKNNKTTEFRKTDRSLLVSPAGSSRVAFDPKKMPATGVLKSPSLSPSVSVKKHATKRATAADFF